MPFHSLENPFAQPKQRNADDPALVGMMLGSKEEEAMRRLLSARGTSPEAPAEDLGGSDDLALSAEEHKAIEKEKIITVEVATDSEAQSAAQTRKMQEMASSLDGFELNISVKVGEKGELCLSGNQLTEGYWKNPQKIAEKSFGLGENNSISIPG